MSWTITVKRPDDLPESAADTEAFISWEGARSACIEALLCTELVHGHPFDGRPLDWAEREALLAEPGRPFCVMLHEFAHSVQRD